MAGKLQGKKVAILATDGVEESELTRPWEALENEGAKVELVSTQEDQIQAVKHDDKTRQYAVDKVLGSIGASDYDSLVLPGGVANPDRLRTNQRAVEFVRDFFKQKKPVAAICHGPWLLVEANVVKDRTLTSWPSLKTDIQNAGGNWVDEEVHVDQGLVTSRKPDDLDAFCNKMIEEIGEGKHARQAAA